VLSITALEYDANIYSTDDLFRFERSLETGITSLSAIDTPATPSLTQFTQVALPYVEIAATVPAGVVNAMEVYVSSDSVNFTFVAATYPEGGGAFSTGQSVFFTYDGLRSGTLYARVRASNSVASSEFSPVGSLAVDLIQQTDQLSNNILGRVTPTISYELSEIPVQSGKYLYGPGTPRDAGASYSSANTQIGKITSSNTLEFTVTQDGWYSMDSYWNWGTSTGATGINEFKACSMYLFTGNSFGNGNIVTSINTSSLNSDLYDDQDLHKLAYLTSGAYHLEYFYANDLAGQNALQVVTYVNGPRTTGLIGSETGNVA
jgi:hypothetical protein